MWKTIRTCLESHPDSTIKDHNHSFLYDQFIREIELHGQSLKSKLKPKSKCAVLCDSGLSTAVGILACWNAGIVAVPLSINYGKKHCDRIIELVNPDAIITDNSIYEYNIIYNLNTRLFYGKARAVEIEAILLDAVLIMCTSGTTGKPKGAIITEDGLQKNIQAIGQYFNIDNSDTMLIARPLYHCAVLTGEFLISLFKGVNIVFFDAVYDPYHVISSSIKHRITVLCGTPTLLYHISRFIKRSHQNTSIVKIALSGECLNCETAKYIRTAFPDADIYHVYGLTEASPRVSFLSPLEFDRIPESVGFALKGISIKIIDTVNKQEVPQNTPGIVMVCSPSLMKGYYQELELSLETMKDGWLNTKDIGYQDDNGYLYILSRLDDMFTKAGMNIYPKEIENTISLLPEISECMAYAEKNIYGDNIVIDIVLNNKNIVNNKKTLMLRFQEVLSPYLMPSKINIVASLQRNASGKIVRHIEKGNGYDE